MWGRLAGCCTGEAVHPFVTFWEGTTTPCGRRDARLHRILRRVNGEMEGAVCDARTRERRYTRYCRAVGSAVVTAARVEKLVSVLSQFCSSTAVVRNGQGRYNCKEESSRVVSSVSVSVRSSSGVSVSGTSPMYTSSQGRQSWDRWDRRD